jgi:hypothetical protein
VAAALQYVAAGTDPRSGNEANAETKRTNMNASIRFAKMLALMPVVALAAACNGVAPTSSTDVSTGVVATASGDEVMATAVRPCSNITDVNLRTQTVGRMVWVQARYNVSGPTTTQCAAPVWTADRSGLMVDTANPFRAGYPASTNGIANVTATAPNHVSNTIRLNLGRADFAAPAETVNQACRLIDAVRVTQVPSTPSTSPVAERVTFEATYSYSQPVTAECTKAPSWTASRKGLVVANDGFHASIARVATARTTVTATAPNRVKGSLTF